MMEVGDPPPLGLIVAVPIFLCINIAMAVIGARWMNRLSHDSSEDVLTAHYLGGRSFGPWLTLGTMFASLFSGFTIIGIPNGAYNYGWIELEWVATITLLAFVFSGVAPRLRKASLVRDHQTPSDFITDMFQSQLLRYAIITIQLISQFIWMTSNLLAVKNAFNAAFNLDPNSPWITIGVVAFILVSEWFGGLSAVALTDTVQGAIMVFGAVSVTCVIKRVWGGWVALDPLTFPRPDFYQTPTKEQQWIWWQICLLDIALVFYPVSIQRIYAASNLEGIKMGAIAMWAAPWVATLGTIFIGTMGVQIMGEACADLPAADQEACMNPASPFAAILEQVMALGGFPEAAAVILYTSALAAIMSTTDSVLISISQIITSDIIYPMRPQATPKQVAWFGRGVSLIVSALSLILGLTWKGSIIKLFELGTPIAMNLIPPYMIGLYMKHRPHPWSLAIPTIAAIIAAILIITLHDSDVGLHDAIFVLLLNCAGMILCELGRLLWTRKIRLNVSTFRNLRKRKVKDDSDEIDERDRQDPFPNRPAWDKPRLNRFGENALSPRLLDKMMGGMQEPMKNWQYCVLMLLVVTMSTPLTPESQPTFENDSWVTVPVTFRGLPWWVFKAIIITFLSSLLVLPIIISIPKDYPFDKDALRRSGIDADIVELEPEERGGRVRFDERNEALAQRRALIRAQTARIKLAKKEAYAIAEETRLNNESTTDARGRLGSLVKQPTRRVMFVFGESKWTVNNESEFEENVQQDEGGEFDDDVEEAAEKPAEEVA